MSVALKSYRGISLVWCGEEYPQRPTITCELWPKRYELFVVEPYGRITTLDYHELHMPADFLESAVRDHDPNPKLVEHHAELLDMDIDPVAFEILQGAWSAY